MIDSSRHVPLLSMPWSVFDASAAIEEIVKDALAHSDAERSWPSHPSEDGMPDGMANLYFGAADVIWGLDYLARSPTWRSVRLPQKLSDWRDGRGCDGISPTAASEIRALPSGSCRPQSSRSFDRSARCAYPRQCSALPSCSRPSEASRRRMEEELARFPGLHAPGRRTAPKSNCPAYRRRQKPCTTSFSSDPDSRSRDEAV
jgi:hypothetical protein